MAWRREGVCYLELSACKLALLGSQQFLVLLAFGMKTPASERKGEGEGGGRGEGGKRRGGVRGEREERARLEVMTHTFNPSTWEA